MSTAQNEFRLNPAENWGKPLIVYKATSFNLDNNWTIPIWLKLYISIKRAFLGPCEGIIIVSIIIFIIIHY